MSTYAEKLEQLQHMRAELRNLERQAESEAKRMQPLTVDDERHMVEMQARADGAYMAANRKAPPPHAYERPDEYERRLAGGLAPLSSRWGKANVGDLPNGAFAIARDQIYADALANGRTHGLKPHEIRERVTQSSGGHKVIEFDGGAEVHFTQQFTRPPRFGTLKSDPEYRAMSRDANLTRIDQIVRQRPLPQPMRTGF
jgi:hypothetical protein